jgi:replicative DNA helicase
MPTGLPAHDAYAERVVVSAAVLDPLTIHECSRYVTADDFYTLPARAIWEAVVSLDAEGREVALDAVASWLHERDRLQKIGGASALAELIDAMPAIASAHEYARAIAERAAIRRTGLVAARIAAEAMSSVEAPREWLGDASVRVAEVTDLGRLLERDPAATAREVAVLERVEVARSKGSGAPGLSTGFRALDHLIGRMQEGTVVVLGAATGIGKTGLALAIALNVARADEGVAYATVELPREELLERALASASRIPSDDLFSGCVRDDQQEALANAAAELARLPLVIDDATNHSIATLRGLVRRGEVKLGRRIRLLVVDYLQLIRAVLRRGMTTEEAIGEVSRGLLALAKDLGIAVLALSQFNRGYRNRSDKVPQVTDLRGSGQIEQDARAIILLHRASPDGVDPQIIDAIVPKARGGGRLGTTGFVLRRTTATWASREDGPDPRDPPIGRSWSPGAPAPRPCHEPEERDDDIPDGFGGLPRN